MNVCNQECTNIDEDKRRIGVIKLKELFKENQKQQPSVEVMDILQLVLDLEDKVLEIKKKLKDIPQPTQPIGKKIDKDFFKPPSDDDDDK